MPNLRSVREEARRAQNRRLQERDVLSRALIRRWGHWGRELPPRHEERYLQVIYLNEMEQQREKLHEQQLNNNSRRRNETTSHYVSYNTLNNTLKFPKNETNKKSAKHSARRTQKNKSNSVNN
tara:strand:+ start:2689 stop:3057 length:369 start_codon:yes stop_codon:yes gene_type:complete